MQRPSLIRFAQPKLLWTYTASGLMAACGGPAPHNDYSSSESAAIVSDAVTFSNELNPPDTEFQQPMETAMDLESSPDRESPKTLVSSNTTCDDSQEHCVTVADDTDEHIIGGGSIAPCEPGYRCTWISSANSNPNAWKLDRNNYEVDGTEGKYASKHGGTKKRFVTHGWGVYAHGDLRANATPFWDRISPSIVLSDSVSKDGELTHRLNLVCQNLDGVTCVPREDQCHSYVDVEFDYASHASVSTQDSSYTGSRVEGTFTNHVQLSINDQVYVDKKITVGTGTKRKTKASQGIQVAPEAADGLKLITGSDSEITTGHQWEVMDDTGIRPASMLAKTTILKVGLPMAARIRSNMKFDYFAELRTQSTVNGTLGHAGIYYVGVSTCPGAGLKPFGQLDAKGSYDEFASIVRAANDFFKIRGLPTYFNENVSKNHAFKDHQVHRVGRETPKKKFF